MRKKPKYEEIPLEEIECSVCGKVEKVHYINGLTLPYLCKEHYLENKESITPNLRQIETKMGFKQAIEYVLSVLCYAYYVKNDNLIADISFDQLEKVYCKLFDKETAPNRAMESETEYTNGVKVVYEEIKKKNEPHKKD